MLHICVQTNETNPSKSQLLLILMYLKTALAFVTIREKKTAEGWIDGDFDSGLQSAFDLL